MEALRDELEKSGAKILTRTDVKEGREIARGAFGRVIMGTLKADNSRVVIKRVVDDTAVQLFSKEIKLLQKSSHPNIVQLRGVCLKPFGLVLEYLGFDLDEMKIPETEGSREGSTLAELLSILADSDLVDDVGVRRRVLHKAAVDVAMGLAFLHHKDICHRDLKPANVLVTNLEDVVIFKLADFGEARGSHIQTAAVLHNVTNRVQRGTRVFFAPEQLLETLAWADIAALRRVDMWCYGMVVFCLLSPDFEYPWKRELADQSNLNNVLEAMTANKLPKGSDRYKHLSDHTGLGAIFRSCCHFEPALRPVIDEVLQTLTNMTYSRTNTGISASPAAEKHVDGHENLRQPAMEAESTLTAVANPRARDLVEQVTVVAVDAQSTLRAADNPWYAEAAYDGLRVTAVVGNKTGPGCLQNPWGVSAHGDLVWVADRSRHRVVVFRRKTEGGQIGHHYVGESAVYTPVLLTATGKESWISQRSGQLQGFRLQDGAVVRTRSLPVSGQLRDPRGLDYRESRGTLYVCCGDGVHVVDVAEGGVVAALSTPPEAKEGGRRPWYVSVLHGTILVSFVDIQVTSGDVMVLYTGDGEPGRILRLPGLQCARDIANNGHHFVVSDPGGHSLRVLSREGEEVTEVALGEIWPRTISGTPQHQVLYVTDRYCNKLFVVSR